MGISRSSSFVIAYLMKFQNMSFIDAFMFFIINLGFVVKKEKLLILILDLSLN